MTDFKHEYYRGALERTERELSEAHKEIRRLEAELSKWQDIVHTLIKK